MAVECLLVRWAPTLAWRLVAIEAPLAARGLRLITHTASGSVGVIGYPAGRFDLARRVFGLIADCGSQTIRISGVTRTILGLCV